MESMAASVVEMNKRICLPDRRRAMPSGTKPRKGQEAKMLSLVEGPKTMVKNGGMGNGDESAGWNRKILEGQEELRKYVGTLALERGVS